MEWIKKSLGEIIQFKNGKKRPADQGAIPVYGGNGILGYATDSNYEQCVIIGRVGAYCGSVYYEENACWVSDNAIAALPKSGTDIVYAYYLLKGLNLNKRHIGTSQPLLTQEILNRIKCRIPSLAEQRQIGAVLRALDQKIALNNKINDNLEQQALALYRSLFVDFDRLPIIDRVDSELGKIPKGWSVKTLAEVTTNIRTRVRGRACKVLSAVNSGSLQPSEEYFTKQVFSKDISNYIIVEENDFAYNPARVNIGSIGINSLGYVGCVSPVYVVFRTEPEYQYFMDFFIRSARFKEEVRVRSTGSVRQSMNYTDFGLIKVVYPPIEVVRQFNAEYAALSGCMDHNSAESIKLEELRDSLLPRLMSGEIDLSDIQL